MTHCLAQVVAFRSREGAERWAGRGGVGGWGVVPDTSVWGDPGKWPMESGNWGLAVQEVES